MQGLMVGLMVLLAVAFMIRHIRRTAAGKGGCGCGCGSSGDARRASVPGLSCPGSCSKRQSDKPGK